MIVATTPKARSFVAVRATHRLPCRDLRQVGECLADAKRLGHTFRAKAIVSGCQERELTEREADEVIAAATAELA